MQSEEYDKKIREAAERHHPAYDETAWAGMEKLLDKHMPQEKERKRRLLLLIFLFLLVGGGFYVYYNTGIKEPNQGALSLNEKKTGEGPVKDKDPGSGKQGTFTIRDQQQNLEHGIQENTVSITG
jgi:hypothetical protein